MDNMIGFYAGAGGMLLLFVGILVAAIFSEGGENGEAFGLCGPVRFASLTARPAPTRRRIVPALVPPGGFAELAPPSGWSDAAPAWYDVEPDPVPVALPAPDDAPIPVDWPTRIVQPVPLTRC